VISVAVDANRKELAAVHVVYMSDGSQMSGAGFRLFQRECPPGLDPGDDPPRNDITVIRFSAHEFAADFVTEGAADVLEEAVHGWALCSLASG